MVTLVQLGGNWLHIFLKLEIKNTEKLTVITFSILYTEENEINAELFQLVHVAIYVLVFKYRFGLFLFITYGIYIRIKVFFVFVFLKYFNN